MQDFFNPSDYPSDTKCGWCYGPSYALDGFDWFSVARTTIPDCRKAGYFAIRGTLGMRPDGPPMADAWADFQTEIFGRSKFRAEFPPVWVGRMDEYRAGASHEEVSRPMEF
jgi:hypothetical protein